MERTSNTWREQAKCRGIDPNLFFPFPNDKVEENAAKAVCATCPVRNDCLEFALTTRQDDGIWGGLNEDERRKIIRQRGNAKKPYDRRAQY